MTLLFTNWARPCAIWCSPAHPGFAYERNPIWQKSTTERAAAFATAFAGAVPAERKTPSIVDQLQAVGTLIVKKRQEGFTVDQIRAALQHPAIAIDASTASIRRLLRDADRRREQRRKARAAALLTAAAAAPLNTTTATPRPVTSASRP